MEVDIFNTENKYNIIYADPPWQYDDKSAPGGTEKHYPTMSIEDIKKLPVSRIASDNCYLFIWATFPMIKECLDTISAWGFKYKTIAFNWVKHNKKSLGWFIGSGNYTRSNAEICLIGTKGKLEIRDRGICSVIDTPVMEHSVKPDIVRKNIVKLLGDIPRIELFARYSRPGWDAFGNQISGGNK